MTFQRYGKPHSRAFTLIELLIVIAIISILAAILFPVFARARENARRTSCLSNLKQIGLAFLQYTQDYDEAYPLTSYGATNISWTIGANPYMKSIQLFRCPSDNGSVWNVPAAPPTDNYYTTSYLMNAWMAGSKEPPAFDRLSSIQSPSVVALLTESNRGNSTDVVAGGDHFHPFFWGDTPEEENSYMNGVTWNSSRQETKEIPLTQHMDGFNIGYADGHVKWHKWPQVWPPKSGQARQGIFDPRNETP